MSNSPFDPDATGNDHDFMFETLADPFRRRVLTLVVLSTTSVALAAAGIPLPSLATSARCANGGVSDFAGIPAQSPSSSHFPKPMPSTCSMSGAMAGR